MPGITKEWLDTQINAAQQQVTLTQTQLTGLMANVELMKQLRIYVEQPDNVVTVGAGGTGNVLGNVG